MTAAAGFLWALVLCLQAPSDLITSPDAPYIVDREFVSPVTGEKFVAKVLKQGLRPQSYDYDRCPHPPINTLAYTMVIDPVTGYVAYPEDFNRPCQWSKDRLAEILGKPKFKRQTPDGLLWSGAYAWERFENAALLAKAANLRSSEIADYWLLAAWSVRLDVISGSNEFDTEVRRVFLHLPRTSPDPGDLVTLPELQLAHAWQALREQGQLQQVSAMDYALAQAWLYRSRGELKAARRYLNEALAAEQAAQDNLLYRYLDSSVKLEQDYLCSAAEWLGKAWEDGEIHGPGESWAAYLLGEICRRTGDLNGAQHWYDQALQMNKGTLNTDLVKHQQKLLDTGEGY